MKKQLGLLIALILLSSLLTLPHATVRAQSKTIIVPDNYPTITDAIGNATNGDTILVRSGTYEGPINGTLVINKSLSIIGENTQETIVNLYPAYTVTWILDQPEYSYTDAITITANSCSLEDLTLQIANGGYVTAEGNNILIADDQIMTGWATGVNIQGSNCRVTDNVMDGNIVVTGNYNQIDNNSGCFVDVGVSQVNGQFGGSYNFVKDNTCQGLALAYSSNNVFFGNDIIGNSYEPAGIDISQSTNNFIYENQITGLIYGYGLRFWYSSNNTIEADDITNFFDAGLSFANSNNNLFSLNNFYGAPHPYTPYVYDQSSDPNYASAGITLSINIWSYGSLGNYWGDYIAKYPNASEVDSTGVGSIPYVINENNTDSYPLMSNYDISTASIQLPDWTNLTLPAIIPTPVFPSPNSSPTISTTPTLAPTPTAPEFPSLILVLTLFIAVSISILVKMTARKRKTVE